MMLSREWLVVAIADTRARCARAGVHFSAQFAAPQSPLLLASFEKELGGSAGKSLRRLLAATDGLHLSTDKGASLVLGSIRRIVEDSRHFETLTGRRFLLFADFNNGVHAAVDPGGEPSNGEYPVVAIDYESGQRIKNGAAPPVVALTIREFVAKALDGVVRRGTFTYWL